MRIAVTGGSGMIGSAAVDLLVSLGHDVTSFSKTPFVSTQSRRPTVEVVGDLADDRLLQEFFAAGRFDAVVHLAAHVSPVGVSSRALLVANAVTTLSVLECAANCGVAIGVIASSTSILGMAWSEQWMPPLAVPISESHPIRPTEGYALAKEFDEASARMAAARWGMTVVALRFPFVGSRAMLEARRDAARVDHEVAASLARELWGYLDLRDAAVAIERSIEAARRGDVSGTLVFTVAADDVLADSTLTELMLRWYPTVDVAASGARGAYDSSLAERGLGFRAVHVLADGAPSGHTKEI